MDKPRLLSVLPFRSKSHDDPSKLSAKDKRYLQAVERALLSFELLEEWADYIAFLARLQKALQLPIDAKSPHTITWIPQASEIADRLSLCLSSKLPNGVHQKTLALYDMIFNAITTEAFNSQVYVWLPGLLPVLSFGSIQVKSEIINLFKLRVFPMINGTNLKVVTKPMILSFLAGLDDENAESFGEVMELMETLKKNLEDDGHFWRSMFLGIISNPEKRLGALHWCNKRLPVFTAITTESGELQYSDEATCCISPSPGLLVRAFSSAVNTHTVFNPANDIIVIRGFFDLMLDHLPLSSDVLHHTKEKEILMKACSRVLLKKDMSLNRRLWNWLLGPDSDHLVESSKIRAKYFEDNGLNTLVKVLLDMIQSKDITLMVDATRMSLSLIIDKWEISHILTPRVFYPILTATFEESKNSRSGKFNELLAAAQEFFNGVESSSIWKILIELINAGHLQLLGFILSHFDIGEEEMVVNHVPLALITLLSTFTPEDEWFTCALILIGSLSPKGLAPIDTNSEKMNHVLDKIDDFYLKLLLDEQDVEVPLSKVQITTHLYRLLKGTIIDELKSPYSCKLCDLFEKLVNAIPFEPTTTRDELLVGLLLNQQETSDTSSDEDKSKNLLIAFSMSKLFHMIGNDLTALEKTKVIKTITTNLWPSLVASDPTLPQVESVKCLFDLTFKSSRYYVEPAISVLISRSSQNDRIKALNCLWSHSNSNETDSILELPLRVVLDELFDEGALNTLHVKEFIRTVLKSGHANRLLRMTTNPLLNYDLMEVSKTVIEPEDGLAEFAYHLKTILNVLNSNSKNVKEAFNNEFAVMDNSTKLEIIRSNEWDISTYKSLISYVIEKFLDLKLLESILKNHDDVLEDYYNCVTNCLELFSALTNGNEPDFTQKFHKRIENCFYFISLPEIPYQIELVECQYLKCIFHLLKISEDARINLNLLHVEDEGRVPFLVKFIIKGIERSQISVLLQQYMILLTRSLYLFNESVFSVLSPLNTAIIDKIKLYFDMIVNKTVVNDLVDFEASINELVGGIEDLLSISHSYLLTSKFKSKTDSKISSGQQDSSFLGNVIQGVFLIESPAVRSSEQNKLYSILLAFQDATKVAFEMWKWADDKSKHEDITSSSLTSHKSILYLGNKLKYRSKKLLESLMDLERQEVIEILIENDKDASSAIKLLHVLDGGRTQVTLPFILNSIMSRCYPSIVESTRKSHLSVNISEKDLTQFLIPYFWSVDTDSVTDIWNFSIQFFKDVLAHQHHFKPISAKLLKVLSILSLKLSNSKFGNEKRHKKELGDLFTKFLSSCVSGKKILFGVSEEVNQVNPRNSQEDNNTDDESSTPATPPDAHEELIDVLIDLVDHFDEIIQDSEKSSSSVNLIIYNLITPQIKGKKVGDISVKILQLLDKTGTVANRAWKGIVNDLFMDPSFFQLTPVKLAVLQSIISQWLNSEPDKFNEFVNKIVTSSSSAAGTLFMYNEKAELENKILTLKRISFMILVQPEDYFLSSLDELFNKLEISLSNNPPLPLKSCSSVLLRAVTIKFNELYLLPRWTMISQELISIFESILNKSMKELSFLNDDELKSVLFGCKLLDQLLLLSNDEFNMQEWLFVNSTFDINTSIEEYLVSIIDKFSKLNDLTLLKELPIKMEAISDDNKKIPLLRGVSSIKSIASLRNFFESLSYLNFERVYGLYELDIKECQEDVKNDIFK